MSPVTNPRPFHILFQEDDALLQSDTTRFEIYGITQWKAHTTKTHVMPDEFYFPDIAPGYEFRYNPDSVYQQSWANVFVQLLASGVLPIEHFLPQDYFQNKTQRCQSETQYFGYRPWECIIHSVTLQEIHLGDTDDPNVKVFFFHKSIYYNSAYGTAYMGLRFRLTSGGDPAVDLPKIECLKEITIVR